ncbi:MAG: hypothetical protein OXF85_02305 [Candidatus Saccharibacteria bacterium]|nr:hypothetical protein [Candidatus Saccharibacteria bacterium]
MSLLRWFGRIFSLLTFLLSLSIILIIGLAITWGISSWYRYSHNNQPQQWGLVWSSKEAKNNNLTTKDLDNLLSQIPFKKLQLMTYWDIYEIENDEYQFENLKDIFELARGRHVKIDLQLGLHQSFTPSCHQPDWAKSLNKIKFQDELKSYIEKIILEFDAVINLEQYLLEPEIFQANDNQCLHQLTENDLEEFYNFTKSLTDKPIIISRNNNSPLWRKERISADGYGISLIPQQHLNQGNFFAKNIPSSWYTFTAGNLKLFHAESEILIRKINLTTPAQQDNLEQIFDYLRRIGIKKIYLDGASTWLNNPAMFEVIKKQIEADF